MEQAKESFTDDLRMLMREVIHYRRQELIAELRTDLIKGRELII